MTEINLLTANLVLIIAEDITMKIRSGFVSNSSSSSFIVGVPSFKETTIEGRISELYEVAKEYEYDIDELPYLRGWNLEKVKELAEKGYTFEYLDVPFGCEDNIYNFLNRIGAVTVVDFGG